MRKLSEREQTVYDAIRGATDWIAVRDLPRGKRSDSTPRAVFALINLGLVEEQHSRGGPFLQYLDRASVRAAGDPAAGEGAG